MQINFIRTVLVAIFLTSFFLYAAQAQNSGDEGISEKARNFYEQSQQLILARKFDQAISTLNKAVEKSPTYAEAYFRLGNVYELMADQEKSITSYEKSVQLKPNHAPFISAYQILAAASLERGEYEKAKSFYEQFLSMKPVKVGQVNEAKRMIINCEYAIEAKQKPLSFKPTPMSASVNKFPLQYFPTLTADQQTIIFTARRKEERGFGDENLYISYKTGEDWSSPVPLSDRINTVENEGTSTISADGRTLVFTSCEGRQSFGSCDLFVSYRAGDEWSEPVNLGNKINTAAWESQPSLTADGRTLYFVSDRRGGYGKRDIWVSRLGPDGYWGIASNLGPAINTPDDDLSPFIHTNSVTLYFSSKGLVGMGGYDLFKTEFINNAWTVPQNLGYPINTHEDQVSLFVTADGKKGYYSVEEKKGRQYVSSILHEFDMPQQIAVQHVSDYLKGTVYDAKTKKRLNARIEVINLNSNVAETIIQSDRKTGEYLTVLTEGSKYALYVNKDGYLFKSLNFDFTENKSREPLVLDIYMQPIEAGSKDILNNLFFATGQYTLETLSKTELEKLIELMKQYKDLRLEISGHTDDVGKDEDNLELSKKRAKNVYDYLVKAGVPAHRLKYEGYGETRFYVPNNSEANRAQNRRIEFKVL
jgi:outer membrane protein OmpA-like peptidoglycan-associated protein/tetratricopeptide (TPR) repeat protein